MLHSYICTLKEKDINQCVMLHYIGDGKKEKAKYSNELTTMYSLLFVYNCFQMLGEKKKKGKEPTTLNRGII